MSESGPNTRARLILPSGLKSEDFLSGIPDVVSALLRDTCEMVETSRDDAANPIDPRVTAALDGLGEGVAVVVGNGEIVWMNDRLAEQSPELLRRFGDACREAVEEFARHPEIKDGESMRLDFRHGERAFEVLCSPMPDDPTRHAVAALVSDVTELKQTEAMVEEIDRAGGDLLDLDPDTVNPLDVASRLRLVEDKIVRTIRSVIGFEHFEVRLVDRRTGQLELVMGSGMDPLSIGERLFARPDGNGISGWVAASGRAYLCPDIRKDPRYQTGIPDAASSLTVPIRLLYRVVGVLNIESERPDDFDERDQLLVELYGRYIAMAVNILDMLVVERYTTNRTFSTTVLGELGEPLDAISRNAAEIRATYIGDAALAGRLDAILSGVESVRERVLACSNGPRTILGAGDARGEQVDDPLLKDRFVLVADDEPTIREAIHDLLKERGARVQSFADGAGAIEVIELSGSEVDLVISDVQMPDRNGYEVFRSVRKHAPHAAIVLMTGFGYDPNHSIVRSSEEGLEACLFKPFRVDQLFEEVHKAMRAKSSTGPKNPD
ncbi:MAG: response regulator [Planctomycetota bacterium]|nr:response regulator [Planctomycetota bacterium]